MHKLKPISRESIPAALERAERYRLLNEPREAESICLDVLGIDPENPRALVTLLLALTDQFDADFNHAAQESRKVLARFEDIYSRTYHEGVICEREAKAHLKRDGPVSGHLAHDWLIHAMECYEKAEAIRPPGNDEAILRWNTCARMLERHDEITTRPGDGLVDMLE